MLNWYTVGVMAFYYLPDLFSFYEVAPVDPFSFVLSRAFRNIFFMIINGSR